MDAWRDEPSSFEPHDARRARVSERYAEYGAIGQEGGAAGAASAFERLGAACARHVTAANAAPDARLATLLGELHESVATGAADAVRAAE
jgi:hypothetical protein